MTLNSKCGSLILAATLCAAVAVRAEGPPMPPPPAPELAQLDFFAGSWTCTGKADASPMGPAHDTSSTVAIAKQYGGHWYFGHFEEAKSAANPMPMAFGFAMGWDPAAKMLTMDGYDAFGGRSHQTSQGWKDGKLVFEGQSMMGPGPSAARDTFVKSGDKTLEHTGEMQVEGKWVHMDHEVCTKK